MPDGRSTEPAAQPSPSRSAWRFVCASARGKRPVNDDFVHARMYELEQSGKPGCKRYFTLVACDGVGSLPGSGACATALGSASLDAAGAYLRQRKSKKSLPAMEAPALAASIAGAFSNLSANGKHASTFVQLLFSVDTGVALWAGDSRAYTLSETGRLKPLTRDHADDDGRLSSYVTGSGQVSGTLDTAPFSMRRSIAVCVTTDGVHDHCYPDELRKFILYCMAQGIADEQTLREELEFFIGAQATDNLSLALWYRVKKPQSLYKLSK